MISERDIAEKFSAVWHLNFPLLTSNYIRVFNETQLEKINLVSIESSEGVRYDLVSETAFNISRIRIEETIQTDDILSDPDRKMLLLSDTAKSIWKSGNYSKADLVLTEKEIEDVRSISDNLLEFIESFNGGNVEFRPKLKGYSFIPNLDADISIDDTLFEVKTVTRNFKSSDLKQLFIYLALKQVSGSQNWKYAGLYNPRKGVYCKFNIGKTISSLTGGKSPNEAFENLLNDLTRDVQIDSKF